MEEGGAFLPLKGPVEMGDNIGHFLFFSIFSDFFSGNWESPSSSEETNQVGGTNLTRSRRLFFLFQISSSVSSVPECHSISFICVGNLIYFFSPAAQER